MDLSRNRQSPPSEPRTRVTQGAAGHPITEVCLHTSATTARWWQGKTAAQMRDEIRRWHMAAPLKWRDIGYHFVVAPDGTWANGRALSVIGAGVAGRNQGVVHICMVPITDVLRISRFDDWYTRAQRDSVKALIRDIRAKTDLARVTGHNQFANKLCPGFRVVSEDWL
ncbi:N-acetylmuramoyl-L-alanine amidase [Pseudogemmobacter sonorensis]|uniref:N-acetylmuramoyl-L-alanine amidase n=1 Tax=Pseudogemmobacter sonorensis TaxID=2989681 RepID=UPI00369CFBA8